MEEFIEIEAEIAAAFAAGDAAGIAAHYTEDAALMPPFRGAVEGRAAIEALYRTAFAQGSIAVRTEVEEAEILGETAWFRGTFHQTFTPKQGGQPMTTEGKYIVIARRAGEGWLFHRDIFNGNQPPRMAGGGCLALLLAPLRKLTGK